MTQRRCLQCGDLIDSDVCSYCATVDKELRRLQMAASYVFVVTFVALVILVVAFLWVFK